jgi:polysaccharide biosynthesis protein PslH
MRILYFSSRDCWPPNTGARIRDYYLAREMARQASVTYFGLPNIDDGRGAAPPAPEVSGIQNMVLVPKQARYTPWKLFRGLWGPEPVTVLNCETPRGKRELARLLDAGSFDTVQMEGVHLIGYLPVLRAARGRPRVICDWHNIESEILRRYSETVPSPARRWYARRTAQLIERAENRLLRSCDAHVVVSERERLQLLERVPEAHIHVVGNGVDTAYFDVPAGASEQEHTDIVFVGSMNYHANIDAAVWLAREVWPAVREQNPALRLCLVGCDPAPDVRALGALERVIVTGTVEDLRPYYRRALVAVAPLRSGSGTRLKILEAMAARVPVLSTTLGAEGLDISPGRDLMIADSAVEIARAIVRLSADPEECERLSRSGHALVQARYDWRALGQRLSSIHQEVAARAAR